MKRIAVFLTALVAAGVGSGLVQPNTQIAPGIVLTYTATPCGFSSGPTYEVLALDVFDVPLGNLAVIRFPGDPDLFVCATVDVTKTNNTEREDMYRCENSGYSIDDCEDCIDFWGG